MKKLNAFSRFDAEAFFADKKLQLLTVNEWTDYDTHAHMGLKADVVIIVDHTEYPTKPGEQVTNKFEKLTVKVKKDVLSVQPNDIVRLVNPVCTIYGDYRNQLSITADDLELVATPTKKA
jgi:Ni,Fe-hydrogenase maturation factor